jgi:glutathione S-transferase
MRRVGFWEQQDEKDYWIAFLTTDQPAVARVVLRGIFPLGWRYMSRRYDFDQESFERSRIALVAALDRIESERAGGGHLVGDTFTVADLTAAALLFPLVWPPEFQYELPDPPSSEFLESVKDHPALDWIRETWRRFRGRSAEVR